MCIFFPLFSCIEQVVILSALHSVVVFLSHQHKLSVEQLYTEEKTVDSKLSVFQMAEIQSTCKTFKTLGQILGQMLLLLLLQ